MKQNTFNSLTEEQRTKFQAAFGSMSDPVPTRTALMDRVVAWVNDTFPPMQSITEYGLLFPDDDEPDQFADFNGMVMFQESWERTTPGVKLKRLKRTLYETTDLKYGPWEELADDATPEA